MSEMQRTQLVFDVDAGIIDGKAYVHVCFRGVDGYIPPEDAVRLGAALMQAANDSYTSEAMWLAVRRGIITAEVAEQLVRLRVEAAV